MNKEYMDSRAKHIRFLVGSAMHKAMVTLCWGTPSIVKHEGSEAMGAHEIRLQSTAEGVTHLYEAIDALQDACRRFSFFEVVQAVLSDPVLKFYTADTRTDEAFEEKHSSAQTPSAVKAKPEPQPVASVKRHGKKITQGFKHSPELFATIMNARKDGEKHMAEVVKRVLAYGIKQYDSKRVFPPLPESIAKGRATSILVPVATLNAIKGRARRAGVRANIYATQMIVAYFKNHKH